MAFSTTLMTVLVCGSVLALSACDNHAIDHGTPPGLGGGSTATGVARVDDNSTAPRRNFPQLIEINVGTGNAYSTVKLRFDPGRSQPSATIQHSKDATVLRPGSGKPVALAGDQALRVAVTPAVVADIEPLHPNGPVVAEVQVLGFFEGRTALGIGIYGDANIKPRVSFDTERHTLTIALRNPGSPPGGSGHDCGDVAFAPASDAGAFNIVAQGVSCQVARNVAAQVVHHGDEAYTTDSGFTCLPEVEQRQPVRNIIYSCLRAEAWIRFDS